MHYAEFTDARAIIPDFGNESKPECRQIALFEPFVQDGMDIRGTPPADIAIRCRKVSLRTNRVSE
jgi:hypothetical protein